MFQIKKWTRRGLTGDGHPWVECMGRRLTLWWLLLADGVLTARVVVAVLLHRVVLVLLRVLRVVLGHDAAASVLRHWRLNGCGGVERARAPRVVVWPDRVGWPRCDRADGRFRTDSDATRNVGHDARITAAASDDTTSTAHNAVVDVVVCVTDGSHSDTPVVDSSLLGRSGRIGRRSCRRLSPGTDGWIVVWFDVDARWTVAILIGFAAVQFVLLLVELPARLPSVHVHRKSQIVQSTSSSFLTNFFRSIVSFLNTILFLHFYWKHKSNHNFPPKKSRSNFRTNVLVFSNECTDEKKSKTLKRLRLYEWKTCDGTRSRASCSREGDRGERHSAHACVGVCW